MHVAYPFRQRTMPFEAVLTLAVIGLTLVGLYREFLSPDLLLLGALGALIAAGVVPLERGLSGFGDPTLLALGSLYAVSAALRRTGVLERAADLLLGGFEGLRSVLLRVTTSTAVASGFLNNTPIVAMGIPTIINWAEDRDVSPSKLLIPLSYAAILGGTCTLIGTSTNLIADGMLRSRGMPGLGFFELAAVGVPAVIVGILYLVFAAPSLLPERETLRETREEAEESQVEMEVADTSSVVGHSPEEEELRDWEHQPDLEYVRAERPERQGGEVHRGEDFQPGDLIVFEGAPEEIEEAGREIGLEPLSEAEKEALEAADGELEVCEAVVPEGANLVGASVDDVDFSSRYGARVIGVVRDGERLSGDVGEVEMEAGDTLLLEGRPGFTETFRDSPDFYLVQQRQEEEMEEWLPRPIAATGILAGVIVLAATGTVHISVAALFGAGAMLLLGLLTPSEARRAVDWSVLIVIGASLGLGEAMEASGAAELVGGALVSVGSQFGPVGILAAGVLGTMLLTAAITNNAAIALMFPVVTAAANAQGLDARPFVIGVTVAASTAFVTPLGYQTNLMVYGPGGYRFGDFARAGGVLQALVAAIIVAVVPLVWGF